MLSDRMLGIFWTISSAIAFVVANALVRHLSQKLPPLELAFFRASGGLVMIFVAFHAWKQLRIINDPIIHLLRAVIGSISLIAIVHAYSALPLALVTAVLYLRVIIIIPLQHIFLKEKSSGAIWIGAMAGVVGGVVALWPRLMTIGTPEWSWAVLSLTVAPLASSGSQVCMRRLAKTNPPSTVVAVAAILISCVVAMPASTVAVIPPTPDIPLLLGMAVLSGLAQWATVKGYRYAAPARLMPLTLIDMPLAVIIGIALFAEYPQATSVIGAVLIIGAAVFVSLKRTEANGLL